MSRKAKLKETRRLERAQAASSSPARLRSRGVLVGAALAAVFLAVLVGGYALSRDSTPEPSAGAEAATQGPPAVGDRFAAFRLAEVDGRSLTLASLEGKPAIVWFTTSYCVPCQVGARAVARLDDELGGKRFNVLVVFVDPQESRSALTGWRERYANPDWLVALDSDAALANDVRLVSLDTKFLLDENGTVRNIDYAVAGDDYVRLIRKEVDAT